MLLVAAFVRVSALLSLKNTIYFDYLLWDEQIFHTMAEKIANGSYHSKSVYEFSSLPIYLMAFLYKIFSPDILVIRILHMILGVLTCLNIYLIGKLLCNNSVGLLAALIAALYKPFIFYSIVPLKTSLSIFLFSLLIILFISALFRITPVKILFIGLFAGLILNVRPNCLVFIPFLPVLLLWGADNTKITVKTCSNLLILFIIGLFLAVSPFLVRNYKVAGVVASPLLKQVRICITEIIRILKNPIIVRPRLRSHHHLFRVFSLLLKPVVEAAKNCPIMKHLHSGPGRS